MQGDITINPFIVYGVGDPSAGLEEKYLSALPDDELEAFSSKALNDSNNYEKGSAEYIKAILKSRLASAVRNYRSFPMGEVLSQNANAGNFDPNNDENVKSMEMFFNSILAEYAGNFNTLNRTIMFLFPDDPDMQAVANYNGPTHIEDVKTYNVHDLMANFASHA